ncbi:MIF4G like-domain-containing protein [Tirmania nivea]|nr:MIF4G like-domain-containing protein [Tirmania nivea]
MGDYYRGGRGAPRSRNKRYRDDYDDEREYRRPHHESLLVRLQKELLGLAESPLARIEDGIKNITKLFTSNYENEELRAGFRSLIQQVIIEQPFKIPFVAAVTLVSASSLAELGADILEDTHKSVQKYLDEGNFTKLKLSIRFLGCCQGMYLEDGVFKLLNELLSKAEGLKYAGNENVAVELTRIVMISLPYILASSGVDDKQKELAGTILERTAPLSQISGSIEKLLRPLTYTGNTTVGEAVIKLLQLSLQNEASRDWSLAALPRPWEAFKNELDAARKYSFPDLAVPAQFENMDGSNLVPDVFFSVFAHQSTETVPPTSDITSHLFRDSLNDTMNILDFNRIAVARFLVDIDCYFAPEVFLKRATPYDRVKEVAGDRSTWKPEDVAVDAVFSQLLRLPNPEHKLIYYHSIFTEMCKIAAAAVAPSLGRAIRFMYANVDSMDVELTNRFIDWFSHHLSNFGFTWKWGEWEANLKLTEVYPKRAFIHGAIEKEIRLSFPSRIKNTLPEAYQILIPEAKEKDIPTFKYDSDDTAFSTEGKEVFALLKDKKPEAEIDAILESVTRTAQEQNLRDPSSYARDIYITSICYLGAKSLSHVLSCIERCKEKLLAIGQESAEARRQIVRSVMGYWADQPGVGANVVDKLLNYSVITPSSVVEWALCDAGHAALSQNHVWEMVSTTVNKVNNRVRQIVAARPSLEMGDEEDEEYAGILAAYETTLDSSKVEQKQIAEIVLSSLRKIADGERVEGGEDDEVFLNMDDKQREEYKHWMAWWGLQWLKAFARRYTIEGVTGEEDLTSLRL